MKTANQVSRYISFCSFSNEDWVRLRQYLKEKYGQNFHKPSKPKVHSSYDTFMDWEANGIATGDVVSNHTVTGIVNICVPGICRLAAYTCEDDGFVAEQLDVDPATLTVVSEEERQDFLNEMGKLSYDFVEKYGVVAEKFIPQPGSHIAYQTQGKDGFGVLREIHDLKMKMYFAVEGEELKVDYETDIVGTSIRFMTKPEKAKLDQVLLSHQHRWNEERGRLEKCRKRANMGERYWYITDKFTIRQSEEKGEKSAVCNIRYQRGNYFTSLPEAMAFLEKIMTLEVGE